MFSGPATYQKNTAYIIFNCSKFFVQGRELEMLTLLSLHHAHKI